MSFSRVCVSLYCTYQDTCKLAPGRTHPENCSIRARNFEGVIFCGRIGFVTSHPCFVSTATCGLGIRRCDEAPFSMRVRIHRLHVLMVLRLRLALCTASFFGGGAYFNLGKSLQAHPRSHHEHSIQVTNPYETDTNNGCPDGMPTPCLANGGLRATVDGQTGVDDSPLLHPVRYRQHHLLKRFMCCWGACVPRAGRLLGQTTVASTRVGS